MHVHLLGDSTLDNVYWVDNNNNKAVVGQLKQELGPDYTVYNHAYDGFTTRSVLEGDKVGLVLGTGAISYANARGRARYSHVKPLEELKEKLTITGHHYVLISVGGNDFRENLAKPHRLISRNSTDS